MPPIEVEHIEDGWNRYRRARDQFEKWWHEGLNRRTLAIIIAVTVPFLLLYLTAVRPPSDFPINDIVTVEQNMVLGDIANSLYEQKIVRSAAALELVVRVMGAGRTVHAGDYQFKQPTTLFGIARAIAYGYFGLEPVRIRVPEGSSVDEMAPIFERYLPRFDAARFVEIAKPHEGYMYPDTYFFLPNATEEIVFTTMRETFDEKRAAIQDKIDAFGKPLNEVVIMASLLEKEAHKFDDRRKIAGVLWHRLDINMALQVDAAFLYFLGRTTYALTLKDLQADSPYNTYKYKGLPPGPITNPSLRAIEAAVTPIDTGAIFYLADRYGNTYYSKTYEEHLRKKRIYIDQ